jgi:predicted Fe-Mo cluster-binding NifX family protein
MISTSGLRNYAAENSPLKVAVSASGGSLDAPVDPRFGRCPYFLIVDTETMNFESFPNASLNAPSGAGIGAAQIVVEREVQAVLTGSVGPNAMQVLSQAGVKVVTGVQGSVRQVVEDFRGGVLKPQPDTGYGLGGFYGGGGRGMGRGRGIGMGQGMGIGHGIYPYPHQPPAFGQPPSPTTREEEIKMLTLQKGQLERQLEEVKKRLEELGK